MRKSRLMLSVFLGMAGLLFSATAGQTQSADPKYRIFKADGSGPHPAVAFVSGCSGFTPTFAPKVYERVAEQLRSRGYVVIFVDYLGRRGLQSCAGSPITHADAAKD